MATIHTSTLGPVTFHKHSSASSTVASCGRDAGCHAELWKGEREEREKRKRREERREKREGEGEREEREERGERREERGRGRERGEREGEREGQQRVRRWEEHCNPHHSHREPLQHCSTDSHTLQTSTHIYNLTSQWNQHYQLYWLQCDLIN